MADQILPSKEASLFKSVISFHEYRQYKKGLKTCEQILKKCPQHAETLAMKGLFLGHLDKKEEGYETIKQAIKLNFKSHVCWHVFGLLHRNDKNYEEAQKCYKSALRFDPENGQILRDLAVLQLQTGHYQGHLETRLAILKLNPAVKMSWIALAIGYHLVKSYDEAISTIDQYLDTVSEATGILRTTIFDNESGQVHLYRAMILEEAEKHQECLDYLKSLDFRAGDILKYRTTMARMHLNLGHTGEALKIYSKLFSVIPEYKELLKGIEACNGINETTDQGKLFDFYKSIRETYPQSQLVKLEYLHRFSGDKFEIAFKDYALPMLKKGAPSLFKSIQRCYKAGKEQLIELIVKALRGTFENVSDPKAQFWCHYFLAQHYLYLKNSEATLSHLEAAFKLDETVTDLFVLYGKLAKKAGQTKLAAACIDHARKMDLGDRYLNSKTAKYLLRDGKLDESEKIVSLFCKEDELEKQMSDLREMQCNWFEMERGDCLAKEGKFKQAHPFYLRVCKNFDDFVDDQLDFHNYAMRKQNLVDYVKLLRYEQQLYSEDLYYSAASKAINCIMKSKTVEAAEKPLEEAMSSLTISDSENPIIAEKLLENLKRYHPGKEETLKCSFDFAMRQGNLLEAVHLLSSLNDLHSKATSDFITSLKAEIENAGDATEAREALDRILIHPLTPSEPTLLSLSIESSAFLTRLSS